MKRITESPDPGIDLLILEKYETIPGLYSYDVEDYLLLLEIVLVDILNKRLNMMNSAKER